MLKLAPCPPQSHQHQLCPAPTDFQIRYGTTIIRPELHRLYNSLREVQYTRVHSQSHPRAGHPRAGHLAGTAQENLKSIQLVWPSSHFSGRRQDCNESKVR